MEKSGIPTTYHGYKFRSRLEATWACFFDQCEWKWKYEPFDYEGYIPDFVLLLPRGNVLLEVKPELSIEDMRKHTDKINRSPWPGEAIIVGVGLIEGSFNEFPYYLGLLGERDTNPSELVWGPSTIHHCINHIGFQSADGAWRCRYQDERIRQCFKLPNKEWFHEKWAHAQNMVQWAPKMFGIESNAR